jgi:hypothetical protein
VASAGGLATSGGAGRVAADDAAGTAEAEAVGDAGDASTAAVAAPGAVSLAQAIMARHGKPRHTIRICTLMGVRV